MRAAGVRPVHLQKVASLRNGRKCPVTGGSHGAVWLCLDALLLAHGGGRPAGGVVAVTTAIAQVRGHGH
jgi:hypothetical protein